MVVGINLKSPIKWVGEKRNLRKELVSMMSHHKQYVEVFAGAMIERTGYFP